MTSYDHGVDLASIAPFYSPRSIAIVGASGNLRAPGGRPIVALRDRGYAGEVYPVNPKHEEIYGYRCYPSLLDVPANVDLVVISVPAAAVLEVIEQSAKKRARAAVIFSAGFGEIGKEGQQLQRRITETARRHGIRLLGPNCLGLLNVSNAVMASFAFIMDLDPPEPRTLGFVTQSGAFGAMLYAQATEAGVGFTSFASVGNEADTEFADFAAYLLESEEAKIVGGYLEGARDGRKLRGVAVRALDLRKPIVILKVGRTGAGARAASSHTGSLAGDDQIYDAFFRQTGIVRIQDLGELVAFAILHRTGRRFLGNKVGILSGSGGHGVLLADRCESLGMQVPEITGTTRDRLREILPAFGSPRNPVDLTAQAATDRTMLTRCLETMLGDDNIDLAITQVFFHDKYGKMLAQELIRIHQQCPKPIVLMSGMRSNSEREAECLAMVKDAGLPVLSDGLHTVQAVAHMIWYEAKADRWAGRVPYDVRIEIGNRDDVQRRLEEGASLTEAEGKKVLERYGIPVTREVLATSADGAVTEARRLGYPVALKVQSAQILHKTEAGAIALRLGSDDEVRAAYERILASARRHAPAAEIEGVLVQEMVDEGLEIIVGATRDPVFGHVVMFGLGGIFVEALRDIAFRVAPLERADAEEMLDEIKGKRVLDGLRGKPPADREAIIDVLMRVSALLADHGEAIDELDINPLVVFEQGAKAVDALITTRAPAPVDVT